MAMVMIGVDPHKASHTAVAIDAAEERLGQAGVRASGDQVRRLLARATGWPERTRAVEGADGAGHLLAQQLLAAGERVLDVQPKLSARVRLLATGQADKNDPNDGRSVAIAALRSASRREAVADDHAAVLRVWSRRRRDPGRNRARVVCRLHAVVCELVPGGLPRQIRAGQAARAPGSVRPADAVAAARRDLAAELIQDLRHIDAQILQASRKLAAAVKASGTTVTGICGAGPVIAAAVIGDVREVARFPGRDHLAAYNGTAPVEVPSGQRKVYRLSRRGSRRLNHAIHIAAITQIRHQHTEGRACFDKKLAEGKTPKEALRSLKRHVSNAIFARLQADASRARSPAGQPGNDSAASAAGSHPERRLFGQATPGPFRQAASPAGAVRRASLTRPPASRQCPQRERGHSPPLDFATKRRSFWKTATAVAIINSAIQNGRSAGCRLSRSSC
ncbi:MAG: IS110 family transposase [Streptosporangiaceae bacterium]